MTGLTRDMDILSKCGYFLNLDFNISQNLELGYHFLQISIDFVDHNWSNFQPKWHINRQNQHLFLIAQLILRLYTKNHVIRSFGWRFNEIFLVVGVTQRLSAFALPHNTHPYVLLHCEITKNDENANEPNLERRMITLVGELVIFSKLRFYSCPDPLDFGFCIIFKRFY